MNTIINDSVVTIDSTNETVSNLTMNNCVIDDASTLDLSRGTNITISGCSFKHVGILNMANPNNANVTNCYFEQMDLPKEERIEYMEEWLKDFDEDMYAQWLLWSAR